jgi:hypothetical protein
LTETFADLKGRVTIDFLSARQFSQLPLLNNERAPPECFTWNSREKMISHRFGALSTASVSRETKAGYRAFGVCCPIECRSTWNNCADFVGCRPPVCFT